MRVPPLGRDNKILPSWPDDESQHGLGAVYAEFLRRSPGLVPRTVGIPSGIIQELRKHAYLGPHENDLVRLW